MRAILSKNDLLLLQIQLGLQDLLGPLEPQPAQVVGGGVPEDGQVSPEGAHHPSQAGGGDARPEVALVGARLASLAGRFFSHSVVLMLCTTANLVV